MSAPFRTGISVLYAGARWQVLHVLDAETVLLRAVLSARHAPRAKRLKRPALSDGSPARIPVPQRPGRRCRLTARPATFACVTVPAWSDNVTDHGQEYIIARPSRAGRRADNDAARRAGECGPTPPPRCPDHRLAPRGRTA